MFERVIERNEQEYKNLQAIADSLTINSKNGYVYKVRDTYLDFGQDWKWTTIIREDARWGGVQILSPRQWSDAILADDPIDRIKCLLDIVSDEYFNDK